MADSGKGIRMFQTKQGLQAILGALKRVKMMRIEGSTQVRVGRMCASALLSGYAIRITTEDVINSAGKRKLRNPSRQAPPRVSVRPRNHHGEWRQLFRG